MNGAVAVGATIGGEGEDVGDEKGRDTLLVIVGDVSGAISPAH